MEKFDLAIAYVWEYDVDFLHIIEDEFQRNGLKTFVISYHNLNEVKERVVSKNLYFNFLLDRASDVEEEFLELGILLKKKKVHIFNEYQKVEHAIDKASMHLEFITAGINVPYSIIIPPLSEREKILISVDDLAILGRPFIIKPCNTTGGGVGVVTGAESLHEVLKERGNNREDKYILQQKIYPAILDNKRAWFRCFFAFGKVIPVWWDDQTHNYCIMSEYEKNKFKLEPLIDISQKIGELTKLDFFSTEIVLNENGDFVAIDYVNDQCDMRLKSLHYDGVPDEIVRAIANELKNKVLELKKKK